MHQEPPKEAQDRPKRSQEQPNNDFNTFSASNLKLHRPTETSKNHTRKKKKRIEKKEQAPRNPWEPSFSAFLHMRIQGVTGTPLSGSPGQQNGRRTRLERAVLLVERAVLLVEQAVQLVERAVLPPRWRDRREAILQGQ